MLSAPVLMFSRILVKSTADDEDRDGCSDTNAISAWLIDWEYSYFIAFIGRDSFKSRTVQSVFSCSLSYCYEFDESIEWILSAQLSHVSDNINNSEWL